RQRVGLAQALIHDPEVLILDEPTSGLDPNQIVEIRELIKSVGKEKTVMLSTHIMQEVEAICDRVIIVNKGNIVADNKVGEIVKQGGKSKVLIVEFSGQTGEKYILQIPGVKKVKRISENQWAVEHAQEVDIRKSVFDFAVGRDLAVLEMKNEERSLEEVFKSLTQD
ncbi:MAG: AAA family ATPase, partial [Luteibaculum sp.]